MRLSIFAVALVLVSVTSLDGQDDERRFQLLGKYREEFAKKEVRTVDQTFSIRTFGKGDQVVSTWHGRMVVDFDKHRLVIEQYEVKEGRKELSERTVILPEKGYIVRFQRDEIEELPPRRRKAFGVVFEDAARHFLPVDYSSLKYEESVKYGELIQGQQVSARPSVQSAEPIVSLRFLFDKDERLVAVVRELVESSKPHLEISVLAEPASPGDHDKLGNKSIYQFHPETGKARLVARQRVERVIINQPVNESLFRIDQTIIDKKN